ncbi:MAG: hypothetical protein IJ861_04830 [Clostridia bacterium]|nr:hypothetical protein [Clostridia bacterium]
MSYDLMIFEKSRAPRKREDFMKRLCLSFNRKSEQKLNPSVSKAEVTSQRQSEN